MTSLIPEKRLDKNGVLVTRHVKDGAALSSSTLSIPAPTLSATTATRPSFDELTSKDYEKAVLRSFLSLTTTVDTYKIEYLLRQIHWYDETCGGAARKLYDLLPDLDARGVQSLTAGVRYMRVSEGTSPTVETQLFSTAIMAYEFSRDVEEARLFVTSAVDAKYQERSILAIANSFLGESKKLRVNDGVVADLEGRCLLGAIGLEPADFNSEGDYYRGLTKLKEMQDEIKPYLPLLVAWHEGFPKGRSFYFNDDYYLWDNIEVAKKIPVDRVKAVAVEVMRRGDYDEGLVEEVINSSSDVINDGLL